LSWVSPTLIHMSILSNDQIDVIEDALDRCSDGEGELYRGYSGRGMYGRTCVGIVVADEGQLVAFGRELERAADRHDVEVDLGRMAFDSMGLRMIAYWPNWDTADEDEDDEIDLGPMPDGGRSEPINGMYDV